MTKKIGVTGGIGSGKSVVCEIFKNLGVPVFNADVEAKKLLQTKPVKDFYWKEFGEIVFTNDELDRQKIATIIFNQPKALEKVNHFIHPLVLQQFQFWYESYPKSDYVIHESALIFESYGNKILDATLLVYSPIELRINRVIERDNASRESILSRIKNQMNEEEKKTLADYVVLNDNSTLLIPQVLKLHEKFISGKN